VPLVGHPDGEIVRKYRVWAANLIVVGFAKFYRLRHVSFGHWKYQRVAESLPLEYFRKGVGITFSTFWSYFNVYPTLIYNAKFIY
jgi:hypothetical protein